MKFITDALALPLTGEEPPPGFEALTGWPLVIITGLTGVGKSTVLELLPQQGLTFTLLPNRRSVTDELIIAALQAEAGEPVRPVPDRLERFEYTARYRAKYPGGLAHALSRLAVNPAKIQPPVIFDGLRGLEEVQHAVPLFPQARFLVLDAPDTVRLNRLLQRGDAFDTAAAGQPNRPAPQDRLAALLTVPKIETVFSEAQLRQIAHESQAAQIPPAEVVEKISIIVKERCNYDSGAARDYLTRALPPRQVLVIDTSTQPAQAVAQQVAEWLTNI